MGDKKVKVLYIAGWGRSGSTILDNILGQIDGFFSVGELRYIWDRNLTENRLCGCGVPFKECEVWRRVLKEAFGEIHQINAYEIVRLRGWARTRHLPLMLLPGGERLLTSRLGEYPTILEKIYRAIQSTTGSKVIVDSSKFPSYAWVLRTMPAIDLYVVHLIRDPRGVAYSWLRRKLQPSKGGPAYMERLNPVASSLIWNIWNLTIEALWRRFPYRYLMLRYEDFVDRPQEAVECILNLVQEKATHFPFIEGRKVALDANHTTSGNPSRFQTGTIELRPDMEWKEKMKQKDKAIVTMLTWPLLLRYGYLSNLPKRHSRRLEEPFD